MISSARPAGSAASVPGALDELVDLAVARYRRWAHGSPVLLVHAATAPRAAALVLPTLPETMWAATYDMAWAVSATIIAAYRPAHEAQAPTADAVDVGAEDIDTVVDRAVASGDEHAIKFVEVAVESHARGNGDALAAGERAGRMLGG